MNPLALMRTLARVLLVLAVAVGGIVVASPADAAARRVYVDYAGHVPSSWQVYNATQWVDQYTGTDMVYGRCRVGYKCIRVRMKTIDSRSVARTFWPAGGSLTCKSCWLTIYLNPQRNNYSTAVKRRAVEHEMGHANGITWESYSCTNTMYYKTFCPSGSLPPHRFLGSQKTRLRAN